MHSSASSKDPVGLRTLSIVLLIAAIVVITYWVLWFLIPGGRDLLAVYPHDTAYITFQNAFPIADGWLAVCAAVSSLLLFRRRPIAIFGLLMTASAGFFLASMDILYDLENGVYTLVFQNPETVIVEIFINLITVGLSGTFLWWALAHRTWFKESV
jgi:hypothetical protein